MDNDEDDDTLTDDEIAQYEEDTFKRVVEQIYSTIWIYTRRDDDLFDPEAMRKRIIEAVNQEGIEEFMRQREDDQRALEEERSRKDTAVVRKPNDIGATWHRPLTDQSVVCGKPIPTDAVHGNIGDPDVYRTFLCRACLRAGDNLSHMRMNRKSKENRLRRG
jgi:hypothetical protein